MARAPAELAPRPVVKRECLCKLYDLQEGSAGFRDQPYTKFVPERDNELNTGRFAIQHERVLSSLREIITLLTGWSWKDKVLLCFAACQCITPFSVLS